MVAYAEEDDRVLYEVTGLFSTTPCNGGRLSLLNIELVTLDAGLWLGVAIDAPKELLYFGFDVRQLGLSLQQSETRRQRHSGRRIPAHRLSRQPVSGLM